VAKYTVEFLDPQTSGVGRQLDPRDARIWTTVDVNNYGQVAGALLNSCSRHPAVWNPKRVDGRAVSRYAAIGCVVKAQWGKQYQTLAASLRIAH
jgi:hypothetical protein